MFLEWTVKFRKKKEKKKKMNVNESLSLIRTSWMRLYVIRP